MNNKILIPIIVVIVVVGAIVVVMNLDNEQVTTDTNTSTVGSTADPLQAEEASLDVLIDTYGNQESDDALVPEFASTLDDLQNDSSTVSADNALDESSISSEEQALTDLETSINTSNSDDTTVNESTNTLLNTAQ